MLCKGTVWKQLNMTSGFQHMITYGVVKVLLSMDPWMLKGTLVSPRISED